MVDHIVDASERRGRIDIRLAQGTVCKILDQEEVKPHKVRYYLEQRDPDFAEKMAEVLCVYRQVKIVSGALSPSCSVRCDPEDVGPS